MNNPRIENQIKILKNALVQLIDRDYVYLDIAEYYNVGDNLIAIGAFELFRTVPFNCRYKTTIQNCNFEKIDDDVIILCQGGGNFGDIYRGCTRFRNIVVERFPNHKIIFLPQSIHYQDKALIGQDAELYAKHKNLTIIVRDEISYDILNQYFGTNKILLLPDTAFGLYYQLPRKVLLKKTSTQSLYFRRKDSEFNEELKGNENINDTLDWIDIVQSNNQFILRNLGVKITKNIRKYLLKWGIRENSFLISNINFFRNWYLLKVMYPYFLKKSVEAFLMYDKIYTTRLHGAILAEMLHIEVELFDNTYNKLNNYYDTWFRK